MSINRPEPAPAPSEGPACWDRVCEEWGVFYPLPPLNHAPTHADILAAFRERDAMGEAKYGTRLRPHDGRNSLVDAAQELMDALVYLTKHQMESGESVPELVGLRRMVFSLVQRVGERA